MKQIKKIGVFCASSNNMDDIYYKEAARLGKWIAENDKTLVYGGSNCGLMEATAKSTHENGGKVIGVVPQIIIDHDRLSKHIDELIVTKDLTDRKQGLVNESDILVALPGSVGTLDEIFTVLSGNTIGLHDRGIIVWNVNHFWDSLLAMISEIEKRGGANKPMRDIIRAVDTLEELVELLH